MSTVTKIVRSWALADLPTIREITWITWLDTYSSFIPLEDLKSYFDEHYSEEALTLLFRDKHVDGFVAESGSKMAGYEKNMFREEEGRYYVSSLYILPHYQGQGLGQDLLCSAEQRAFRYGLDRLWLGVMVNNKSALSWYLKHGFNFVEELPFTMGETTVSHVIGYRIINDIRSQTDAPLSVQPPHTQRRRRNV
jgi:ribosomal protein S18 acetylase RimI-like enzyme